MLVGEMLAGNARRFPDRIAWSFEGRAWSWGEANSRANRAANGLRDLGLEHQDRVVILANNSHRLAELYFALAKAGLVAVAVNPRSVAREIGFIMKEVAARVLVASAELAPRLAGLEPDLPRLAGVVGMGEDHGLPLDYEALLDSAADAEPPADFEDTAIRALKYTSGTTGAPKGVISTHRQYVFPVINYVMQTPFDESDRCLLALPMSAGVGIQVMTAYVYRACPTRILPRFDAALVLDAIQREGITRLFAVPTAIVALTEEQAARPRDLSSVRLIEYGGAPASLALMRRASEVLRVPFSQVFGSSETGGLIAFLKPEEHEKIALAPVVGADEGSQPMPCGREVQGYHIRLADEQGGEVPTGEVGEMLVSCDSLTSGYWNQPEQTAEVLRDGWLYTGDLARRDADGLLYIVDRKRDMIISGGINVYSSEVEAVLLEHASVLEAAVIGEPDERWGETVAAFIVPREGAAVTEAELAQFCSERIADYKHPKRYVFLSALPKTSSGKVRKVELRNA